MLNWSLRVIPVCSLCLGQQGEFNPSTTGIQILTIHKLGRSQEVALTFSPDKVEQLFFDARGHLLASYPQGHRSAKQVPLGLFVKGQVILLASCLHAASTLGQGAWRLVTFCPILSATMCCQDTVCRWASDFPCSCGVSGLGAHFIEPINLDTFLGQI